MKPRVLNIVVLGGARVGKTCLISRLVEDSLPAFYQTTPKAVSKKSITLQSTDYTCLITDTTGHATYTPISPQFIIGTHAFLLVYSIDSRESFELVKLIREKLVEFCYPEGTAPIVCIGNKRDLSSVREVSLEEGRSYGLQIQSPFLETSIHSYGSIRTCGMALFLNPLLAADTY
ncbi:P-loop containing nucleoside triphosphate hydrolase protein [Coprinellus micaceus]|uniref:P-loop containing nucleoside triphosphate hydrolase protein n=1 Tax=Coprinellus micaceus TaxID=71717 RepID=A0A4Y7T005_COPMI|nr:P-loop containing nucleoside triphosphate hydrolase protein [Coprinellus micaceus]